MKATSSVAGTISLDRTCWLDLPRPIRRRSLVTGPGAALVLACVLGFLGIARADGPTPAPGAWPESKVDAWRGHRRLRFTVEGCTAWVVEPKAAAPGKPWTWCMEFPDAFTERTGVPTLLEKGFHHLHLEVGNTFGSPPALCHFDAFYAAVTNAGLAARGNLIGISRGGLYAYNWAAQGPGRVATLYGDAPVCDFKSWPGGRGVGKGSPGDWRKLISDYGFRDEAEALRHGGNPVDQLRPLAKAGIALLHVVGDTDDVVPVAENTDLVEQRYRALGGSITVIHKPGVGHHPHGLDDPRPVVEFIVRHGSGTPAAAAPGPRTTAPP